MGYQTFPWQHGDSRSFEKLVSLYLPALKGKSVLDVGCNTGYFCGWAAFQQASHIKGIDCDPSFIAQAKIWFPECSFSCMRWEDLTTEQFDVVLCLSAIHYADDQKNLIDALMRKVKLGGMLVLELGVAPGDGDCFETVQRSIDTRAFPTRTKLHTMLAEYAFKPIGKSVQQGGDPIPRFVYHVYHKLPVAMLLLDEHYSGKSSVAEILFKSKLPRINGDIVYQRIASGELAVPAPLRRLILPDSRTGHINSAATTSNICNTGLLPELAAVFASMAGTRDFILDTYIPAAFHDELCEIFHEAGYFVASLSLWRSRIRDWTRMRPPFSQYEAYAEHLERAGLVDEVAYLEANPDVALAVAEKRMPNAQYHYHHFGRREGRRIKKT